MPSEPPRSPIPPGIDPDLYARLKAESKAPYRGLRQFVYVALGGSGFVGAIVFLSQVLAGRDLGNSLPNLGLQIGVVALMIWLYRLEERIKQRQRQR
jgi:hypothetical protein